MSVQERLETLAGEGLKSAAELLLHRLGSNALGGHVIEGYAFEDGSRTQDPGLGTVVAGVEFDNPVHFGAGWDKQGRAINGLYHLGFGGGTVGTVLPFAQYGNPKPRLWTIDSEHSVGLNRLGFNSPGVEVVERYLEAARPFPFPVGVSVGRNKVMPNEMASWAHGHVISRLGQYASYIELAISSPNTPDLRWLQDKAPFRELLQSAHEAMDRPLPLFAKIDSERTAAELDDMIEVGLEEGLAGFVATNTYMGDDLKAVYGPRWAQETGGLSGNDPAYRVRATATVRHIYERAGDRLAIIGVGGVNSAATALDKIKSGASAVQIVTAIRPSRGKVAAQINSGLSSQMARDGTTRISDYIGLDTSRGVIT